MVGKSARFLAPIALAAVAVGVYLILHSTLATTATTAVRSNTTIVTRGHARRKARPRPKFYTVESGDSLSSISDRTGVPLDRLTALNPSVSAPPYSLQTGQRLRLRR